MANICYSAVVTANKKDFIKRLAQNMQLALKDYSNLTFELWMILHKKDCNSPFSDRSQYLAPINSAYNEKFNSLKSYKEERNFKRCLSKLSLSDVNDAVKRAKKITQNNKEIGNPQKSYKGFRYYQDNPSLSIWEIVEEILTECIQ